MPDHAIEGEEDTELESLATAVRAFDEDKLRAALREDGVRDTTIELLVSQAKGQNEANARLVARDQRRGMTEYKTRLVEEFPYANAELITGTNKREMRASAERMHKHTETILAGVISKTAPVAAAATAAAARAAAEARGEQWVTPPASATEAVRQPPTLSINDLKSEAMRGNPEEAKRKVLADIAEKGGRRLPPRTFATMLGRNDTEADKP